MDVNVLDLVLIKKYLVFVLYFLILNVNASKNEYYKIFMLIYVFTFSTLFFMINLFINILIKVICIYCLMVLRTTSIVARN